MSRRPTPTGLDWEAVTANYVAHGGVPAPEVWSGARKAQAEASRADSNGSTPRPAREKGQGGGNNPLGRGAVVDLSRAQLQDIVDRYKNGETSTSLALAYAVSGNTVLRLLREADVPIRDLRKVIAPSKIPALIERYYAGETISELATSEHVGRGVMSRALLDAGLQLRDRSEARSMAAVVAAGRKSNG
jgi:hypothetical protein